MYNLKIIPAVRSMPKTIDIKETFVNVIWQVTQILNVRNKDPIL
jgi:hypothetical protein